MSQSDSPVDVTPQETTGRTVVGLFSHRSAAELAIRDLRSSGFEDDRIALPDAGAGGAGGPAR